MPAPACMLLLMATPSLPASSQSTATYALIYKTKINEVLNYEATFQIKAGEYATKMVSRIDGKVVKVGDDGTYTLETKYKMVSAEFNGEAQDVSQVPESSSKTTFDAEGHELESTNSGSDESRDDPMSLALRLAGNFSPAAPVKIGETYSAVKGKEGDEPLDFTLARRRSGHTVELVLTGKRRKDDGSEFEVTHWLTPGRFVLQKTVIHITNFSFSDEGESDEPAARGEVTATLTKRRSS